MTIEYFIKNWKNTDKKNINFLRNDWKIISYYKYLSEDFIREFKDKVIWEYISESQKLSEAFIREFQDKVDWSRISSSQKLSEEFIREFKDRVNWEYISIDQKLSTKFIDEFKNEVYWLYIVWYQTLSKEFIQEFRNKIYHIFKVDNTKNKWTNTSICLYNYGLCYLWCCWNSRGYIHIEKNIPFNMYFWEKIL